MLQCNALLIKNINFLNDTKIYTQRNAAFKHKEMALVRLFELCQIIIKQLYLVFLTAFLEGQGLTGEG